jgi:hypothetical protein
MVVSSSSFPNQSIVENTISGGVVIEGVWIVGIYCFLKVFLFLKYMKKIFFNIKNNLKTLKNNNFKQIKQI